MPGFCKLVPIISMSVQWTWNNMYLSFNNWIRTSNFSKAFFSSDRGRTFEPIIGSFSPIYGILELSFSQWRTSLLRRIRFFFFQLWRLVSLQPLEVQGRNLPHFKGLINANWKSSSLRVWRQYYYLPRRLEKGHFTPKMAKSITFIFFNCMLSFKINP